jgi:hypothetical protein
MYKNTKMKTKRLKKIALICGAMLVLLTTVLLVHIYKVTNKKITDPTAIALARVDFKEKFNKSDAVKFNIWFAKQPGIYKTNFTPENSNGIIAYYPTKANPNNLIHQFLKTFKLQANRYLPSKAEMMQGCPVKI